jgi:hypothetical protein
MLSFDRAMTETEWLACTNPTPMLELLQGTASDRKLRLFGCACVRVIWSLTGKEVPTAVEAAEGFADGSTTKAALRRGRQAVRTERHALDATEAGTRLLWGAYWLAELVASENAYGLVLAEMNRLSTIQIFKRVKGSAVCGRLRDVFGNPFRPVSLDPCWLVPSVATLARTAYEERRFEDLPILADALEEAGCTSADLLGHLRGPGTHVLGCWALDAMLGKS